MQLIQHGEGSYSVFKCSGAQGGKPELFTNHYHEDLEQALEAFEDKFFDLTSQRFLQDEEFGEAPGKYAIQALQLQEQPRKRARVEQEISKTLPFIIQDFVNLIFNESLVDEELEAMAVDGQKL